MTVDGRSRRAVAAVAAAGLLAACTGGAEPDPAPTPIEAPSATAEASTTPGDRVAVIVPPETTVAAGEGAALLRAAEELRDSPGQGVGEVRVSPASSEAFARDLANLAVDDGFDLVCVVGTGAAELVLELARARRDARFCTTDGRISGGPVNLTAVALDPAALVEAGSVAIGTAPAPVGLLVSEQVGDTEALTAAFTSTISPPRQPAAEPSAAGDAATSTDPAPTATEASPSSTSPASPAAPASPGAGTSRPPFVTMAVGLGRSAQAAGGEELAAQRPSRALVLATPGGAGAASAVGASGAEVVVVSDWAVDTEGEPPPGLLTALTVDWGAILRAAVATALEEDPPQLQVVGIAEGLLAALPGQVDGGAPAADRVNEHLRGSAE